MKDGIKKTNKEPRESIIPPSFSDFFLLLRKVVKIPTKKPIKMAGNGLGKTFELAP